jgi:hypothetical protein
MSLIAEIIPAQGFEIVRDAIGVILTTELTRQKQLQGFTEDINVFSERITPMDDAEELYINVLLDGATYGSFTEKDTQGRTTYFIDVHTTGKAIRAKAGTSTSVARLHKFVGMCRYILSHTAYKTLNLPLGLIGGTYIESFGVSDPSRKDDSQYSRFARLAFAVRIQENQALWQGINIVGNDAQVKLDLTDKGFQYILD